MGNNNNIPSTAVVAEPDKPAFDDQPTVPIDELTYDTDEFDYVNLLNQALPLDVRALAWSPVRRSFSPRFHCKGRTYQYVFMKGTMDIELMKEAAQSLVGLHDFRNFCKKAEQNVFGSFLREIYSFKLEELHQTTNSGRYDECNVYVATIHASGFIYKQIRKMMSILALVGTKTITPQTVVNMLDVENYLRCPTYHAASPENLIFTEAQYDPGDVCWRYSEGSVNESAAVIAERYSKHAIKSSVLRKIYENISSQIPATERPAIVNEGILKSVFSVDSNYLEFSEEGGTTLKEKKTKVEEKQIRTKLRRGWYDRASDMIQKNNENATDEK